MDILHAVLVRAEYAPRSDIRVRFDAAEIVKMSRQEAEIELTNAVAAPGSSWAVKPYDPSDWEQFGDNGVVLGSDDRPAFIDHLRRTRTWSFESGLSVLRNIPPERRKRVMDVADELAAADLTESSELLDRRLFADPELVSDVNGLADALGGLVAFNHLTPSFFNVETKRHYLSQAEYSRICDHDYASYALVYVVLTY